MSTKTQFIAMACALGVGLSVLSPTPALAHKDKIFIEKHRPERVWAKPHHYRHSYGHRRHAPRVIYVVPERPYRHRYVYPDYNDSLSLGLRTGPYGTYLDLGAGIRLD